MTLGDNSFTTKKQDLKVLFFKTGAEGFEPPRWLDQNQLPYHLATPHWVTYYILKYQYEMSRDERSQFRLELAFIR